MKNHKKKIRPQYFKVVKEGIKNFEVRINDCNYEVGDTITLQEYDLENIERVPGGAIGGYTGQEITKEIIYILEGGQYGLEEGYCILGLKDIEPQKVYVHFVRFKDMKHINEIPFPSVFSTYDKLTMYEEWINKRKDVEVLQVQACVIDKGMKRIESEDQ